MKLLPITDLGNQPQNSQEAYNEPVLWIWPWARYSRWPQVSHRASPKGAQRQDNLELFTRSKICRDFFGRHCQGAHIKVHSPLLCGSWDQGSPAIQRESLGSLALSHLPVCRLPALHKYLLS
jgi:hypothetical protein